MKKKRRTLKEIHPSELTPQQEKHTRGGFLVRPNLVSYKRSRITGDDIDIRFRENIYRSRQG